MVPRVAVPGKSAATKPFKSGASGPARRHGPAPGWAVQGTKPIAAACEMADLRDIIAPAQFGKRR